MVSQTNPTHIPYPTTSDLKSTKGTFHKTLKRQSPYRNRHHSRVTFNGTVKIHGTNITLLIIPDKSFQIQSRNHIITPENDDGYGSAAWVLPRSEHICDAFKQIVHYVPEEVMIAGEFTGKGINPAQAATSDLDRFYVVFGIRIDGVWVDRKLWEHIRFDPSTRVFNVHQFKTFKVVVDFDEERTTGGGKIINELCSEVEKECPVAWQLGGVRMGLGEGIVWTEEIDEGNTSRNPMGFKSKGPKFAVAGKLAPSEQVEADGKKDDIIKKAERFVEYAVTTARLEQGLESLREKLGRGSSGGVNIDEILRNNANINPLSSWAKEDVWKEELSEIERMGLKKGVGKAQVAQLITKRAKEFFIARQEAFQTKMMSESFPIFAYCSPKTHTNTSTKHSVRKVRKGRKC